MFFVHVARMKLFIDPSTNLPSQQQKNQKEKVSDFSSENSTKFRDNSADARSNKTMQEYEVEKIVDKRKIKRGRGIQIQYKVRWKNYSSNEDTWEPLKNLYCPEKILEYERSQRDSFKEGE